MNMKLTRRAALGLIGAGAAAPFLASCGIDEPTTGAPSDVAPMQGESFHYMSLRDVARLIEARELSPVTLTETMLDRIAAVDGRLKSYATVMADDEMAEEQSLDLNKLF